MRWRNRRLVSVMKCLTPGEGSSAVFSFFLESFSLQFFFFFFHPRSWIRDSRVYSYRGPIGLLAEQLTESSPLVLHGYSRDNQLREPGIPRGIITKSQAPGKAQQPAKDISQLLLFVFKRAICPPCAWESTHFTLPGVP